MALQDALTENGGTASDLAAALRALRKGQYEQVASGQLIVSQSSDGISGTFSLPNPGASSGVTQVEIFALAVELTDRYDAARTYLEKCALYGLEETFVMSNGWPNPLPTPVAEPAAVTDAAIITRMLRFLVPCSSRLTDFRLLGSAQYGSFK